MAIRLSPYTAQKLKARALYFEHYSNAQIAKMVGVHESAVSRWVNGNRATKPENTWKYQRQQREAEIAESLVQDNVYHLQRLFRVSIPLVTDVVSARARLHYGDPVAGIKAEPMSIKEAKDLTEIITSLDKLMRLETKKPTELMGFVPISLQQLKEAIKKDLFLDITPDGKLALPKGDKYGPAGNKDPRFVKDPPPTEYPSDEPLGVPGKWADEDEPSGEVQAPGPEREESNPVEPV